MYIVDCKAGRSPAHEKKLKPINEGIKKMKKIFAIMLIAVIAVAGAFATMTQSPASVVLNYTVTETFISKVGFKVAINSDPATDDTDDTDDYVSTTAVDAGTQVGAIGAIDSGYVVIDIYDMSYCNYATVQTTNVKITAPAAWIDSKSNATDAKFSVKTDLSEDTTGDSAAGITTATKVKEDGIVVTYPASHVVDRRTTAVKIGSVAYEWAADTQVVTGTAIATFTVSYEAL